MVTIIQNLRLCSTLDTAAIVPLSLQAALVKEQAVVYNKENMLNPFFVVFGRRQQGSATGKA
jgi:hypothetical protein